MSSGPAYLWRLKMKTKEKRIIEPWVGGCIRIMMAVLCSFVVWPLKINFSYYRDGVMRKVVKLRPWGDGLDPTY